MPWSGYPHAKVWPHAQFMQRPGHTADVVVDDLAPHLVDDGDIYPASERAAELRLDHLERGFDVAPLVIVG